VLETDTFIYSIYNTSGWHTLKIKVKLSIPLLQFTFTFTIPRLALWPTQNLRWALTRNKVC